MIAVENLSKSFGSIRALDNISFELPKGKITVFAGADGAGKSTLFKILIGLIKKGSGDIFLKGEKAGEDPNTIRKIAGYMPERFSLYEDLTVEENLDFFGDIYCVEKRKKEEMKEKLLKKTGMIDFKKRRAGALSGGMKQKLALSTILLSSPEIIILDEPTTGVDPLSRIEFFNIIEELKNEGKTILISTPYLDEAEKGDYIIFIKSGKILKKEFLKNLKQNFKAKLLRLTPSKNIFTIIESLDKSMVKKFYIRGKFIHYIKTETEDLRKYIPYSESREIQPSLEDIYLYYERTEGDDFE